MGSESYMSSQLDILNEYFYGSLDSTCRHHIVRRSYTSDKTLTLAKIGFCERPKVVYTNGRDEKQRIFILGGSTGDHYSGLTYELVRKKKNLHL